MAMASSSFAQPQPHGAFRPMGPRWRARPGDGEQRLDAGCRRPSLGVQPATAAQDDRDQGNPQRGTGHQHPGGAAHVACRDSAAGPTM